MMRMVIFSCEQCFEKKAAGDDAPTDGDVRSGLGFVNPLSGNGNEKVKAELIFRCE
jgi:hypothetical protein